MDEAKVMKVLRQLEWEPRWATCSRYCPWCGEFEIRGHASDCKVGALLGEGEKEKEEDEEAMKGKHNQKVLEELKELQNDIKELGEKGDQRLVEELKKVHKEIKQLIVAAKKYRGALRKARKRIRNPSSKGAAFDTKEVVMVEALVAPSVQIQGCPCPKCGSCDFYCADCYDTWEMLMDEYDKEEE